MHGAHLIKMWSRTQALVALSSAEAELYGIVKATAELKGLISIWKDLGVELSGHLLADASAVSSVPVWAYQVSGEYAMIEAAAAHGWIDGILDPLETRGTLALLLELAARVPPQKTQFGVFRF